MKKLILSFVALVAGVTAFGQAANDLILTQRKADNSGSIQRNVPTEGAISTTLASFQESIGLGLTDSPQFANLRLSDTNASHYLQLSAGSDLTDNRIFTLTTGDAARTLTMTGNATLNQDVSTAASPTFAGGTFTGSVAATNLTVSGGTFTPAAGTATLYAATTTAKRLVSYGPDNSTIGTLTLGAMSANASLGSNAVVTVSDGALSVTGTLGASGNVWSGNSGFALNSGTTDGAYMEALGSLIMSRNGGVSLNIRRRTSDGSIADFYRDTTQVGSISVTTTSTAYNTSSDARLKTNIRDLTGSGAIIDALKPRIFDWKTGEKDTYGFIAQETYSVFPQAVTKGDDGEEITKQWAMDAAKLVPVLTAEIKSLRVRVAALEARIAALEKK